LNVFIMFVFYRKVRKVLYFDSRVKFAKLCGLRVNLCALCG
jgi:hypothetical protein